MEAEFSIFDAYCIAKFKLSICCKVQYVVFSVGWIQFPSSFYQVMEGV